MAAAEGSYRPTESKYKGGAHEMHVTYDLEQKTRGGGHATYPRVKRIYIAGHVKDWKVGDFQKRSGRQVHGVRIDYDQTRSGYRRKPFSARRGETNYDVSSGKVGETKQAFSQIVEVPETARNVHFYKGALPRKYQDALQNVR